MNQLSFYQRHQEVQYAVQHLWQRVKYDVHGSCRDFSGLESEGLQVRKCASGDAESALDAAPCVWHGHTARVTRPMTAGWHASL